MSVMKILFLVVGGICALVCLGWLGLRVKPAPFKPFPLVSGQADSIPLPEGLPAPVENFYLQVYGEDIPVINSFVLSGRAKMRVMGITFPVRFRFTHLAGQGYRHYIEITFCGLPLVKVNERYLDGTSRLELPFGVEEGPKVDQGANLGLWAEALWLPAVYVTDPRVRWDAVDEETALLIVPFGEKQQRFVARFDPETGLLQYLESMRYKGSGSQDKMLWINQALHWDAVDGSETPMVSAATWFDEGTPWAVFTVEEIRTSVAVDDYIREKGL